ncbi:sporulation protein [Vibrio sp. SM6]|uniref:Sporulation protein n=1 Tax=Vibrio agarilyticus TaxID=2726741 RepID=A0A7X8TTP7_9VIBR|nr:sporulation protein [Vibrio agarilyticus]NLS14357.1 sporulation protein [Vibrio agarilyticus]
MSLIKKAWANLGIGNAKVDAILQQDVVLPGDTVMIKVDVYGGSEPQYVDDIQLRVCCQYWREAKESQTTSIRAKQTHTLARWHLPYGFVIEPGVQRTFNAELTLPRNTPVTIGDAKVWMATSLDIAKAADPSDAEGVTVRPDPLLDGVLSALEAQGLRIRRVECEAASGFQPPFVQVFEFVPTTGPFHGRWRELEMMVHRQENAWWLWFAIDRNRSGRLAMFASALDLSAASLILETHLSPDVAGQCVIDHLMTLSDF